MSPQHAAGAADNPSIAAPSAPGKLGDALDPAAIQRYLSALDDWLRGRRSELDQLDRAALAAGAEEHAFSQACARLAGARSAHDLVKAAQDLHALERTLTR